MKSILSVETAKGPRRLTVTCEVCGCRMVLERKPPLVPERISLICHVCETPLVSFWPRDAR